MGKLMDDGDRRTMKVGLQGDRSVQVIAERIDADTPYVLLVVPVTGLRVERLEDGVKAQHADSAEGCSFLHDAQDGSLVLRLTDVGAEELVTRINRALSVLPTSK